MNCLVDSNYIACSTWEMHTYFPYINSVCWQKDNNVNPLTTFKVCDERLKTNKDFEQIPLHCVNHTMGGNYSEHKRFDS
jgi:hypothetical protein